MTLVTDKLRELAGTLAELKDRVRVALAGELARVVADAVRDVVQTVLRRDSARVPQSPHYGDPTPREWREPADPWSDEPDPWHGDPRHRSE